MDTVWLELILIVVAVIANGFFSGSEIAVVSARLARLSAMRDDGVRGAAVALSLKEDPHAFLATIQVAITSVGTLASAVGGAAAVEALRPWLAGLPVPVVARWAEPLALGLVVVAITYVSLVIGELTPKALALRDPERIACVVAPAVALLSRLSAGVVRLLTVSTRGVLWALGQRGTEGAPAVSEEEVKYLVAEGAARGVFEKEEEALVRSAFEFADTVAREIMIPRSGIRGIDIGTPPAQVMARVAEVGHAWIPVYRDSIEHVLGTVGMKEVLRAGAKGGPIDMARLLHPPRFVPEGMHISRLLRDFRQGREELAIVVDEYGSVVGAVTLDDVLDEIVGGIATRTDEDPRISPLPDGSFVLDGSLETAVARARLGLPVEDSTDYQTLAGFVIHRLEAIPAPGTTLPLGEWRLTVVDMDGPRVAKIKAQRS